MSSDEQNRSDGGESRGARRRRWAVRLGALVAVGIAVRAILPLAVEIGIERAASGAVRGQLELGDVDLGLLRGAITLEDLRFGRLRDAGDPGSDAPVDAPVRAKRVYARIAWLDLIERRVRIHALEIDAPRLTLQRRPESGFDLVGLLAPASDPSSASDAADGSDGVDASDGRDDPEQAASADAKTASSETSSWSVALDRGVLEGGRLRLVDLTVERTKRWKARLTELCIKRVGFEPSADPEPTRLVLEGELEGAPLSLSAEATRRDDVLAYRGDLRIQGLPLREMQLYLEDIGWNRLQANVDADLHFEGELTWTAIDGPTLNRALASPIALQSLRSGGRLAVRASAAPGQPVLRLSGDLELENLSHEPEAQGSPDGHGRCLAEIRALRLDLEELRLAAPDQDPRPLVIRLAGIELEDPHLEIDRTDEGLGCGELLPARTAGDDPREDDAPSSEGTRIEPRIRIDRFTTRGGTWVIRDRTVSPFVTTRLQSVKGTLEGMTTPATAIRHFEVSARGLGTDPLQLNGSYEEDRLELELALERVGLPRYNPYLIQRASFVAVERGDLSLRLDLSAERQHGVEGDLRLVLHDADLTALSPEGFRESFGVSLSLAMALLRNVQGDIVIDAPFASAAEDGIDLGVARLVTAALRRALLNALATPLKLVGAVISRDGGIEDFEMQPIVFEPGRTLLAGPALEQIEQLADVLAQRPWLAVQLQPKTVKADRNVQAEPVEGAVEPPKPATLARTRARLIADRLQAHFGVDPERIRVEAVPQEPGSGPPRVAASIVPVGDPLEPEEPLGRPVGASGGASLGK